MASDEEFIAGLLNQHVSNSDKDGLLDVIADYFADREDSEDDSDQYDEDESSETDEGDDGDDSTFTAISAITVALPPPSISRADTSSTPTIPSGKPLCSCKLNDGQPCHLIFDVELLNDTRAQYESLTNSERDIAVLSKIECGMHTSKTTERPKQKAQCERKRTRNDYYFHGRRICRDVFQFIHGVGEKQLEKLIKQYKDFGVEARVHGNKKRLPANALGYKDTRRVVDFIVQYAGVHAITLPGRTPYHWVSSAQLLPTNCPKAKVYAAYKEASITINARVAAERTFYRLWKTLVPFISTMKPATDLCFTCQKGASKMARCANMADELKSEAVKEMEAHLLKVTKERSYLRSLLESTKRDLSAGAQLGRHPPCSFDGKAHYSFDFAQQLQYPANPLQPGPIYFKVPRRCGLFGVHCEPLGKQVNFLIDEGVSVGKGADCVISLLHFFFENFGLGEVTVHLHADNCSGQNKNSAMLQYLLWRVLTGRHRKIELSFLITGHTKFAPDGAFGLIKRRYRRTNVNCLADLADVVTSSSQMNLVQSCGNEAGEVYVPSHQWTAFLSDHFKKFVGIKQFQHFRFLPDGSIAARAAADQTDEVVFSLLKKTTKLPFPQVFPDSKQVLGLDSKRQNYLYREIREFVCDPHKDIVAPKPEIEVDFEEDADVDEEITPAPPKKAKKGKGRGKN